MKRWQARSGSNARGILASWSAAVLFVACQTPTPELAVVPEIDLDRYAGRWYEIASFPQRFQKGCVATSANYTRLDENRIRVENECRDGSFEGEHRTAEGIAWVPNPTQSLAKLKVQFFWPFSGDYWVIELDEDYTYAVIGHPSRDYLWILSRTRSLEPEVFEALLQRIEAHGFDLDRLNRTPQPAQPPSAGSRQPSYDDPRHATWVAGERRLHDRAVWTRELETSGGAAGL